jgi:branched-chain amino acid transport system permease protein
MSDRPPEPTQQPAAEGPRIGVDEWVARVEGRSGGGSWLDTLRVQLERLPPWARLLLVVVPASFIPALTNDAYYMEVAVLTIFYAMLSLGLNVTVGWAGLLDLGYVAFYGFGAYAYALLASGHTGLHWEAELAIPVIVVATALLGFLLGLPSWRLVGDYLAIVTLFFFQIFLVVIINATAIDFPFVDGKVNVTRGPNGISDVKPLELFGWQVTSLDEYFWLALGTFTIVITALYLLNESRIGRAWRALREDSLAAEVMSIPVNWLKLVAFSLGAAVAGLTGAIFAAFEGSVFPQNFDLTVLITIYAMVILGGVGSLGGVVLGAIVINVFVELLNPTSTNASWVFFLGLVLAIVVVVRSWLLRGIVVAALVGFGFAAHAIFGAIWPDSTAGSTVGQSWVDRLLDSWVLLPEDPTTSGKWAYVILIAAVLWLTLLKGLWRIVVLVPTLYLGACVWENVLVAQPAVSRYIILGAMLVALMAARPQGLLGQPRVEIV